MNQSNPSVAALQRAFMFVFMMGSKQEMIDHGRAWGGMDQTILLRVFQEHKRKDHLLALFLLGLCWYDEHIRELLLPLLASTDPFERWASALVLAEQQEEAAIPALIQMLTEHPVVDRAVFPSLDPLLFEYWRRMVVHLLDALKRPALAPSFGEG